MIPTDIRAAFLRGNWKRFTCDEDVPPFAVMRVVSTTNMQGEIVYTTAKPDSTFRHNYMVNGPFYVAASTDSVMNEGLCTTLSEGGYVQYNTSSGTPAVGEVWGPKSGQWTLEKDFNGFEIQGGERTTSGVSVVVATQGTPTATDSLALFTDHVSPTSPTVTYPAITSSCRKFPAYLLPSYTFDDDTTGGSYNCAGSGSGASSGSYGEAVMVYNLTPFHVPKTTIAPVFKVNEKWFIDYRKHYAPWQAFATMSALSSSSPVDVTSLTELNGFESATRYWGFTVDLSTGVFTIRRSGEWKATITVTATPGGSVSGTPLVGVWEGAAVSGGPSINFNTVYMSWSDGANGNSPQTTSSIGEIRGSSGATFKFRGYRSSGTTTISDPSLCITLEPKYML